MLAFADPPAPQSIFKLVICLGSVHACRRVSTLYNPMLAALLVDLIEHLSRVILLLSTNYFVFVSDGGRRCHGWGYFLVTFLEYLLQTAGAPINADLFVISPEISGRIILLF